MNPSLLLLTALQMLPPSGAAASIDDIVLEYESYERMTPVRVPLNPALAEACVMHRPDPSLGPHDGTWMTVLMNASAAGAFRANRGTPYPEGAVVIKRKESRGGVAKALGGMVKRAPGFDSANADWEFFYADIGAAPVTERLEQCGDCHTRARESDLVFGDWAPRSLTETPPR